jgi:uncharacterized protein (DUF697 family)/uncharacterized tellurite resistance protein B-like protein
MSTEEQRALLGLCLMAAFTDGSQSDAERERIRTLIESFQQPDLKSLELYRDVVLRKVTIQEFATALTSPESRLLAYEMAVGVCDSDDRLNDAEKAFLAELQSALGLKESDAAPVREEAEQLISAALPPVLGAASTGMPSQGATTAPAAAASASASVDNTILNTAILAGALELLPSSLATMAILPLQMRLVYRIGQAHGYPLDRRHLGEFLAAAGVGMTSQVLEGYVRKFTRGLFGKVMGGLGRGLAGAFTGSAMSFASTWALGHLAQRYYAGGRTLSGAQLQHGFQQLVGEARSVQQQYLPQIQQRSQGLNLKEVLRMARGA